MTMVFSTDDFCTFGFCTRHYAYDERVLGQDEEEREQDEGTNALGSNGH